jgi:hypothetical protein
MRLPWNRRFSRAALGFSPRARWPAVRVRTRCLSAVLSVVIRAMASPVYAPVIRGAARP